MLRWFSSDRADSRLLVARSRTCSACPDLGSQAKSRWQGGSQDSQDQLRTRNQVSNGHMGFAAPCRSKPGRIHTTKTQPAAFGSQGLPSPELWSALACSSQFRKSHVLVLELVSRPELALDISQVEPSAAIQGECQVQARPQVCPSILESSPSSQHVTPLVECAPCSSPPPNPVT